MVEVVDGLQWNRIVGVELERLNPSELLKLVPGKTHGANPYDVAFGGGKGVEVVGDGILHDKYSDKSFLKYLSKDQ
mgnify:CR=1 FL=1